MPRIEVDFENIDKPIPKGMYSAEIVGSEVLATKADGSTMIGWDFAIIEAGPQQGRKLRYYSNLADQKKNADGTPNLDAKRKAEYYLREFLKTIGARFATDGFTTEDAYGCKAIIEVGEDTFNGRLVNRIEKVMPLA